MTTQTSSTSPLQIRPYSVHATDYIRRGYELFRQAPGTLMLIMFVQLIVIGLSTFLPLGNLICALAIGFGTGLMLLAADQIKRTGQVDLNELKNIRLVGGQLALLLIVRSIIVLIGFILLILPGLYACIAYIFADYEVLFKKADFWTAMERSRRLVNRNFFGLVGLFILIFLLNFVGLLAFGFGIFVTGPIGWCAWYEAIRDIKTQALGPESV